MDKQQFNTWLTDRSRRPLVMGVLNVTPDSFSDGGRYQNVSAAVDHALEMASAGADLIDIGGESTRPGARRVDPSEQIARILPVVEAVAKRDPIALSIDTTRAAVAEAALDAGAAVINDISAGREDPQMLPLAARRQAPIILMHMLGQPATMQNNPVYTDVVKEVAEFLQERLAAAVQAGVPAQRILLDPGIGFGKTVEHNLLLLRHMNVLRDLGQPVVIGTSRKAFVGAVTHETSPVRRLWGTLGSVAWSIANGAAIVRVHDVPPAVAVIRMIDAIRGPV